MQKTKKYFSFLYAGNKKYFSFLYAGNKKYFSFLHAKMYKLKIVCSYTRIVHSINRVICPAQIDLLYCARNLSR